MFPAREIDTRFHRYHIVFSSCELRDSIALIVEAKPSLISIRMRYIQVCFDSLFFFFVNRQAFMAQLFCAHYKWAPFDYIYLTAR